MQGGIDGQDNVAALLGFLRFQIAHRMAMGIDLDFDRAALTAELLFHARFDAAFARFHSGQAHDCVIIKPNAFDVSDITHDMSGGGTLPVFAPPRRLRRYSRQSRRKQIDLRDLFKAKIGGDQDRRIAALLFRAPDQLFQFIVLERDDAAEERQNMRNVAGQTRRQRRAEVLFVVGQHQAVAVENPAALRRQGLQADAIFVSKRRIPAMIDDLQLK